MAVIEARCATVEDTRGFGEALASVLRKGDVLALHGDLGAGKTTLVQGIARGLGFEGHVASPTFTLVREYRGRLTVHHVDVYRLRRVQDVVDLGLDEMTADGVVIVEWGDAVGDLLDPDRLTVGIVAGPDEGRRISLTSDAATWSTRWADLSAAVAGWSS